MQTGIPRRIMVCALLQTLYILLLLSPCSCFDSWKDYVIILADPSNMTKDNALEYIEKHIDVMSSRVPDIRIKRVYKNLAKLGFLGYSISTNVDIAELPLENVKTIEDVLQLNVALPESAKIEYVPFVPKFDTDEYSLSKGGQCTYSYYTTATFRRSKPYSAPLENTVCTYIPPHPFRIFDSHIIYIYISSHT